MQRLFLAALALLVALTGCSSAALEERADTAPATETSQPAEASAPPTTSELSGDPDEPATFQVIGDRAYMVGFIDGSTPDAVEDLLDEHPGVTTIVLAIVPGSDDDEANLEAARMVREAGLATHVPADGEIASGGVDFFLAGATRTFDDGARFGVHSWGTGEPGFNATDLDEDDPEHDRYLDYYDELGVDEDFYWFTIEAAPPEDIHWMTLAELAEFGFRTS